jgi:outer membrane protein assembly factor BamB
MNCAQGAMPRRYCLLSLFMAMSAASPALNAQGRGGSDWSTSGGDAHRSSWLRTDPKISPASIAKPGFQLIWKIKLKNDPRQSNSLTGPVLMDRYIGYRGFRSYAFIGGSADNAFTIDTDLGRIEWQKHFPLTSAPGSATCPGGMAAALTRPVTSAFPTVNPGRGGGGRGGAKSGVGEPFEGAITLSRAVTPPPQAFVPPAAAAPGRAGRGPGRMPEVIEGISSDGMLHAMYVSNGEERTPPMKFLPANAHVTSLSVVDGVPYAATSNDCGGAADGVWALDPETKEVAAWKGTTAGSGEVAFGPAGVYLTSQSELIALEPKTLTKKASFSAASAFSTAPLLTQLGTKVLVVAATKDGMIYVVDGDSSGAAIAKSEAGDQNPYALASWNASGTERIVVTGPQSITSWTVADHNGVLSLEKNWSSHDVKSPAAPLIVNGVLFALQRGDRNTHSTLYALDAITGKQLWTSGNAVTGFVSESGGLAAGGGAVYFGTYDGTLWAFGFPIPH